MKIIFSFLAAYIFISYSHAQTSTCTDSFKNVYTSFVDFCAAIEYCEPNGGVKLEEIEEKLINGDTSQPSWSVNCKYSNCIDSTINYNQAMAIALCTDDVQIPEPPKPVSNPNLQCGSIIQTENQSVGESVPIVGSSISFNYFTSWSEGRKADYSIYLPFTGASPSGGIDTGDVSLSTGGNSVYASGPLSGSVANQGYNYQFTPGSGSGAGSQIFTSRHTYSHPRPGKSPIVISYPMAFPLGTLRARKTGMHGWLPSSYVFYDVNAKRLVFGTGKTRNVEAKPVGGHPYFVFSEDGSRAYSFFSDGHLRYVMTGKHGTIIETYVYNSDGLSQIQYPFGKTLTFNRDGSGNLIGITAPNGDVTHITVTGGNILEIENPNSEVYSMTYYSNDLIQTFSKPNGEVSTFAYDANGFLTSDSHSGGFNLTLARAGGQRVFSVTSTSAMSRATTSTSTFSGTTSTVEKVVPEGYSTTITTDEGNPKMWSYQGPLGTRSLTMTADPRFPGFDSFTENVSLSGLGSWSADTTRNVVLTNDSNPFSIASWEEASIYNSSNSSETVVFDPTVNKYLTSTYLGKTAEVKIDSYERVTESKIGNLDATVFGYTNQNLTSISQGSRSTALAYNAKGFLSLVTNALSQTTGFVYDLAGRVTSVVLPDSRVIGYGYNSNGVLTSVTPPSRPAHVYGYNSSELFNSYQPPTLPGVSVVNTTYAYNNDKQLAAINRPDGSSITFSYDPVSGFMSDYTTPEGTFFQTMDNSTGQPSSITKPNGDITQIYYLNGTPYSTLNYNSSWVTLGSYSASYSNFKKTEDTASGTNSSTIAYLYNDDDELRKAGDININYHVPNGYMTGTTMGSGSTGFTDTYTYNTYGEVTGYQAKRGTTVIYDLTLTRDALGRVSGKSQTMNSVTDAFVYTFDSTGRLTQTDKNSVTVATYSYDSNSNRNGGTIGVQPTTATYDDQDRMLTFNTLSFTYNANGDLASKTNNTTSQTTTYTYDVFGNLRQVVIPPSTTVTYDIDGLNRRIAKRVNGTVQKRWVYMDQYRIAAELNASGAITKRFIYGSKKNIPDYMIASGVKYRIISDHLGSPRLVVKQSDGAIQQRMNHDDFGRVTEDTNPGYLPFGFAGGLYDNQTGLVRFGARDYDSETGRWTSKDPINFRGGDPNLYGYVANNPVNWIDPQGLLVISVSFGSSFFAAESPTSSRGKSGSISSGIAFDFTSGKFFTFHSSGEGTNAIGLVAGTGLSLGFSPGSQSDFFGKSPVSSVAFGAVVAGAGVSYSTSQGWPSLSLDLFGPGIGIGGGVQNVTTCPGFAQ